MVCRKTAQKSATLFEKMCEYSEKKKIKEQILRCCHSAYQTAAALIIITKQLCLQYKFLLQQFCIIHKMYENTKNFICKIGIWHRDCNVMG